MADGATPRARPSVVSAAGSYNLFLGNGTTGTLTVDSGDTFSSSVGGDTGYWVSQGKSVALVVTAGTFLDCELLGTVKARGINGPDTKTHHNAAGPIGCAGGPSTNWYATKTS
jgi:hypothetical protein